MGSDDKKPKIKIMQVSNISVTASRDQIYTMLQYIGRIDDIKIYPSDANITSSTTQKVAFVKYDDERSVEVGQHLTNTVLIDRAVVCVPWLQPTIPDEATFMNSGGPTSAGQRQLPPHVSNKVQVDGDGVSMLLTVDPTLEQLGLPAYPALPGDTDPAKVEEIRRTVYIGNLPKGIDGQTVSDFFNSYIGEVMYVRMASGPDTLPCAYAYVEFSQQTTVPIALQNSGIEFQGRLLKIQHSRVAIIKPQQKTADQALEEVEEAIRLGKTGATADTGRSRTRSPRRRASSPRRRSRSRDRERSRRRSKSRDRKRSRSRDRRRSRSRDKDTRRRSRSRDRRSRRSRSRDRRERSKSRDRKRSRSRDRKRREKDRKRSRSRSRDRSDRKKDKRDRSSDRRRSTKDKKDDKENEKSAKEVADEEEKLRDKLLEKAAARNGTTDGSVSDVDMEQPKKEKTPSKIKNERKRRLSDSD